MTQQNEKFICECGHYLNDHYLEPIELLPLCEYGGCWCTGFRNIYKKPILGKDLITCNCGHTITSHDYDGDKFCNTLGCICSKFSSNTNLDEKNEFICNCGHSIINHEEGKGICSTWCNGRDCSCLHFSQHWADKPICEYCGHGEHNHVTSVDPFLTYVCDGQWEDQGMLTPCYCMKYRETTQNKMWEKQKAERETRPVFEERESLWQRIIKFLF